MNDHVRCTDCLVYQVVEKGSEVCLNCTMVGYLVWVDDNAQEVEQAPGIVKPPYHG
jgi:hypothetical protein